MTVENPRFETAAASGEPGAALGWTWTEFTAAQMWALFERMAGLDISGTGISWLEEEENFICSSQREWVRSGLIGGTTPTRDLSLAWTGIPVIAVDGGLHQISLGGVNATADLPVGGQFRIVGSTGLDAYWTIVSSSFVGVNTVVTVEEDILSTVADGTADIPQMASLELTAIAPQPIQFWDVFFVDEAAATIDEIVTVMREYTQHCEVRTFDGRILVAHEIASAIYSTNVTGGGAAILGFDGIAVAGIDNVERIADLDTVAIAGTFRPLKALAEQFDDYERFETLEETGAIGGEFLSWYECLYGVASPRVLPSDADAFEEGWGTDPMSDPANRGYGCWPVDGNVYGAEINFPITISATRNLLWIYDGRIPSGVVPTNLGNVVCLTITPGVYGDAMDICAELYTRLSGSGIVSDIAFSFRGTDPARSALSIGWNGNPGPGIVGLCQGPAPLDGRDCRATLGLDRLGGKSSAFVEVPTAYFDGPPPATGWAGTPFYRVDVNGVFFWNTMADPDGGRVSLGNGESIAEFDYSIFRTNIVEKFLEIGWTGADRVEAADVETTWSFGYFRTGLDDFEDFDGVW